MKINNKKLLNYFLIFGNPDSEEDYEKYYGESYEKYWKRDYVYLIQIVLGIVFSPIFLIGWILKSIFMIKIKL